MVDINAGLLQWLINVLVKRQLPGAWSEFLTSTSNLPKTLFPSYLRFSHGGKDFQSSYIIFDIFNNSSFFGTTAEENIKFNNTYLKQISSSLLATTYTSIGITNLICSFFVAFVFGCLYNSTEIV